MSMMITTMSFLASACVVSVIRFWLMPKYDLIPKSENDLLQNFIMGSVIVIAFIGSFLGTRALLTALFG